ARARAHPAARGPEPRGRGAQGVLRRAEPVLDQLAERPQLPQRGAPWPHAAALPGRGLGRGSLAAQPAGLPGVYVAVHEPRQPAPRRDQQPPSHGRAQREPRHDRSVAAAALGRAGSRVQRRARRHRPASLPLDAARHAPRAAPVRRHPGRARGELGRDGPRLRRRSHPRTDPGARMKGALLLLPALLVGCPKGPPASGDATLSSELRQWHPPPQVVTYTRMNRAGPLPLPDVESRDEWVGPELEAGRLVYTVTTYDVREEQPEVLYRHKAFYGPEGFGYLGSWEEDTYVAW